MNITIIAAGRVKEKYFCEAFDEYVKRLGAFGKVRFIEIPQCPLPPSPSEKEITAALFEESKAILSAVPKESAVIAFCVEGKGMPSERLAEQLVKFDGEGKSGITVIIGSSQGLSDRVKAAADLRLSMSQMTFPHSLARIMAAEQLYRAFTIIAGKKYHK